MAAYQVAKDISTKTLRSIFNHCKKKTGKNFPPDDYIVADIETTGLDPHDNRVLQIGIAYVKNRTLSSSTSEYVKTRPGHITKESSDINGITQDIVDSKGKDPSYVFNWAYDIFAKAAEKGVPIVGHNSVRFDGPFLEAAFERNGILFSFHNNLVIDTGMIIKGSRINYVPSSPQTLKDLWYSISQLRMKGVFYSINWCFDRFKLEQTKGCSKLGQHDAEQDAIITHHILEVLRYFEEATRDKSRKH